jgi:hypothetical protein
MNQKTILSTGCFLLLALVLFSCTDSNLAPVFYALEQEKSLVDDRGFPDDAVVQRIVTAGTRYFAAAGALYTRNTTGGNWSTIAPPESGALCTNVEIFGAAPTQLLAAFISVGNTGLGLWQRNAADLTGSWSRVLDSNLDGNVQVGLLKSVNGNLFVSTLEASAYSLYYAGAPLIFLPTNVSATMLDGPINDIASDGANYWATVGTALYWDNGAGLSNLVIYPGADAPTTTRPFGSLYYTATGGGRLFLAGGSGKLFLRSVGAWTTSGTVQVDSKDVPFTTFIELSGTPGTDVYAGTKTYGYYSIPAGDITGTLTRSPSYTISALYNGAILTMLFDGTTSLFLGTYGSGLWRGDWVGGPEPWSWKQE